jgi:NAD(P)-dependent dehydrogenase (short-subunit alcohol dehydrogenase family)
MSTALIIGASRALGLALAEEYVKLGWDVIGTVRGDARTGLHDLADASDGKLTVEKVDMTVPDEVAALRERVDRPLDMLFVNAAVTRGDVPIGDVPTDMFVEVMVTNALSPMRVVEVFRTLVTPTGTIAVMSSRQGSIASNTNGGQDVYRASKSALNQLMRCYAARYADSEQTLLLVNPGWVRTELGGPGALLSIEESIPGVAATIERHRGEPGLQFLSYDDTVVPW